MSKKILTIRFRHETNVFCPAPADELAFRNSVYVVGDAIYKDPLTMGSEHSGYLKVFENREDIELVPSVNLYATPSGPVTKDIYDFVCAEVSRVIKEKGPFDGVLMDCHGAMVSDEHQDAEGDLYELIREQVGYDIPLMGSLDLHAHITKKMVKCANALLPYECYPHTDMYETGLAVATLMEETLDGKITPAMAYRRIPFLLPLFPSEFPEMQVLYRKAKELEKRPGVLHARFAHGFFPSDIEEMGMSVVIITDNDQALAEEVADELEACIIENIPNLKRNYPTLDEALDIAMTPGEGPVAIGDSSDNPGAGGLGDTTHILRRILERGITGAAIATILDPESAKQCEEAGVGSTVSLNLGGKSDPAFSGGPIPVTAYVKAITDGKYIFKGKMSHGSLANHGRTAVLEIAGNTVLVTSIPKQPLDLEIFRSHGITPEEQRILVAKSAIHYRASYGTVARELISLSLPGYSIPVPDAFEYKNWKGNV